MNRISLTRWLFNMMAFPCIMPLLLVTRWLCSFEEYLHLRFHGWSQFFSIEIYRTGMGYLPIIVCANDNNSYSLNRNNRRNVSRNHQPNGPLNRGCKWTFKVGLYIAVCLHIPFLRDEWHDGNKPIFWRLFRVCSLLTEPKFHLPNSLNTRVLRNEIYFKLVTYTLWDGKGRFFLQTTLPVSWWCVWKWTAPRSFTIRWKYLPKQLSS